MQDAEICKPKREQMITPQPAFHNLRDAGCGLTKVITHKKLSRIHICGMQDAGLENEISKIKVSLISQLVGCEMRDIKTIQTKLNHSTFKTKK